MRKKYWKLFWPLALVVVCGVSYQVGLKEISEGVHPLLALALTYLAAAGTVILPGLVQRRGRKEGTKGPLFPVTLPALGLAASIVGIELGNIYMFRAGWTVNSAFITVNGLVVAALLFLGAGLYGERITARKLLGMGITFAGIVLIVGW